MSFKEIFFIVWIQLQLFSFKGQYLLRAQFHHLPYFCLVNLSLKVILTCFLIALTCFVNHLHLPFHYYHLQLPWIYFDLLFFLLENHFNPLHVDLHLHFIQEHYWYFEYLLLEGLINHFIFFLLDDSTVASLSSILQQNFHLELKFSVYYILFSFLGKFFGDMVEVSLSFFL